MPCGTCDGTRTVTVETASWVSASDYPGDGIGYDEADYTEQPCPDCNKETAPGLQPEAV